MSFFTLEAVPARYGDCLLLHYGTPQAPELILIDGGPSKVWGPFLKPRLEQIRSKRGDKFVIGLLMVSHIDDDHVLGITDFTGEWVAAHSAGEKWPFPVRQFWHNSFERVSNSKDVGAVTASVTASANAKTITDVDLDLDEGDEDQAAQRCAALKVLASVPNGKKLRDDIAALGKKPVTNVGFDGLVRPGVPGKVPVKFAGDLSFHVVGPLPEQLTALQKMFAEKLPMGTKSALAAFTDTSVPNLSSIVVLARFGGRTMLLTGDARGDYVLEGLEEQGQIERGGPMHVDVLKLPHHGSDRNIESTFFKRITADHYVASADGTFINPDRSTLEMIIGSRKKDSKFTIHLTYPLADIDARRRESWESERRSDMKRRDKQIAEGKKPAAVRDEWDEDRHGLATLIAAKKAAGHLFEVAAPATAGPGAKIELLDPIPF